MMLRDYKGFRGTYFGFRLPAEPTFAETPAIRKASRFAGPCSRSGGGLRTGRQVLWQAGISDFGTSTPQSLPSEAEPLRRTGAFPACPAGRRNPQSGISLIEVIMVMVIIAILAAVVIPRAGFDISPRASVEGAAYMIASDIRYAQECAMANRVSKSVNFVSGASTYTFPATVPPTSNLDPSGRLPSGVTIGTTITITFNSLGEPTTGAASVTISGGGGTKTINVTNYTGKVSIL